MEDKVEVTVLRKMFHYGYVGKRHTSLDNLQKGFPKHERGNVSKAVKALIKGSYIVVKPTGYGQHCSLNVQKIDEIRSMIESPDRQSGSRR